MQQNGCDTAALQRFNPNGGEGPTRDAMAAKVRTAAEAYGRKFYIMYDVTGWTNMQSEIKTDWTTKMSALHRVAGVRPAERQAGRRASGASASTTPTTRSDAAACLDVINWFKGQGCYVIGGVPREWRTGIGGSRAGFLGVYHAFNMISPWMVGAIGNAADSDNVYNNVNVAATRPTATPTASTTSPACCPATSSGRQRAHGDFMWRQFYNMVRVGAQGIYISMFDEYNEGNQIAKTAETAGARAGRLRPARAGRGRHRLLLGLLPAPDRRRRPDAQGPDRADRHPARPSRSVGGGSRPAGTVVELRAPGPTT